MKNSALFVLPVLGLALVLGATTPVHAAKSSTSTLAAAQPGQKKHAKHARVTKARRSSVVRSVRTHRHAKVGVVRPAKHARHHAKKVQATKA